ncbi:hypothetical protein [Elizabethkingia anophelis]|uniref:hypothetical protein n=1 Tax=Elizabethkingia anophelis TaxID=1117645 RepID=UPI00063A9117|nr:hypothetical protein [Elizabethkingia anophelis]AKH93222.1 hypothetical protein M876_01400 [Elizabethkingia anophelis FMS-007]EJC8058892.1 hypothetical protein [Elizabethkingia anophelis]MCL1640337.1 hypothetical protein [Elizabethkingia anophelis]MCL1645245.1 hypothetical protein [Elizabethkingia anophelis]MCT3943553.1 hypothetical protein [Elizabethkingia anophelis]
MIPSRIQVLFDFIDFLDKNKNEYIDKYIPLCNELSMLNKKRSILKPHENYKDKQAYDSIQKEIEEKFTPIIENIYKPVTNKLKELGIWSGDDIFTSIWNNNISEITDFKKNFLDEDIDIVIHYKKKYIDFRTETNNDFMCLSLIFSNLDEIFKELFVFFKDSDKDEFENFETKIVELESVEELAQSLKDSKGKNVNFSISFEKLTKNKGKLQSEENNNIKNQLNVFNMGDNIKFDNISKNKGQITIGKNTTTKIESDDKFAKKSFLWQKYGAIITIIIGIITLIIGYLSMR